MFEKIDRRIAIQVASAYRTVSKEAKMTVSGIVPIIYKIEENIKYYTNRTKENPEHIQTEARLESLQKWQQTWTQSNKKAKWTKTIIKDIKTWVERKHGYIDFHLTQFLTGHGCFNVYLDRIIKNNRDTKCWFCDNPDTTKHTFFECQEWEDNRKKLSKVLNTEISEHNIINVMLSSKEYWTNIHTYITDILKKKGRL